MPYRPSTQGRLRSCDNEAVRTITGALRSWKAQNKSWPPPWTEDDIKSTLLGWGVPKLGCASRQQKARAKRTRAAVAL
jgi:hypothetical protein